MSGQTVSSALAVSEKQDQIVSWVRGQQDEIAMVAATHIKPSAIVRVAHGALRRNEKLMDAAVANPQSLLYALLDAARLGHEPDTDDYYLVPFGNEVTGLEGYKGIIERMYRAGGVSSVVAEIVRERDVYRRTGPTTPPIHEFDEFADPEERGALRGAYAYAVMADGRCSKVITMGRAEVMRHKAKSRGSHKDDSPWQLWEESMWKKCALRGLEPYVPTSTEYRTAPPSAPAAREDSGDRARQVPPSPVPGPGAGVVLQVVPEPEAPGHARPASRPAAAAPARQQPARQQSGRTPGRPTEAALKRFGELLAEIPLGPREDVAAWLGWVTGHPATEELTAADCAAATRTLTAALKAADGDGKAAGASIRAAYRQAHPETAPAGDAPPPDEPAARPTGAAVGQLAKLMVKVGITGPEDAAIFLEWTAGHPALEMLTGDGVAAATKRINDAYAEAGKDAVQAGHLIWTAYRQEHPEDAAAADDSAVPAGDGGTA
jgi:recombination protein RecT